MTAKDYFQDITPPGSSGPHQRPVPPTPRAESEPPPEAPEEEMQTEPETRSIRNIPINTTRGARPRIDEGTREGGVMQMPPRQKRRGSRLWLWGGVIIALLALGAIALVALRPTSVSVIPRTHSILFDDTARFTAYPAASAAEGTLSFTVQSSTVDDSQVVSAKGKERVEEKASGTVTVYNDYQTEPLKLMANTRFESSNGLIFRVPSEVTVPGKKGTTPGTLSITVVADKPGNAYNIAAGKLTVPGLKSTPDMFAKVYAQSGAQMSGGFSGERPAIDKATEDATRAEIRARLEQKVRDAMKQAPEGTIAFPELARISFETLPPTEENAGSVRMNERARVELPVFSEEAFAEILARSVSADADSGVRLVRGNDFRAVRQTPADTALSEPLEFTLEGSASLVWNVDTNALANALAAKDESAFQSIVASFPGIEEAHARIEPFWKNTFPANASSIQVEVEAPEN